MSGGPTIEEIAAALDSVLVVRRATDEEIAAALKSPDVSTSEVARRLRCARRRVAQVREEMGLDAYRRGRRRTAGSWDEAFAKWAVSVSGGHLHWTGLTARQGSPMVQHGPERRSAYRVAFQMAHRRVPEGPVRPLCEYPNCVAGGHLSDRWVRARRDVERPWTRSYRGLDLRAVSRAVEGVHPLPDLNPAEKRCVYAWMTDDGAGAKVIAERIGVSSKTVERWRGGG